MRHIFENARQVLCWLGYASERSVQIDHRINRNTSLAAAERQAKRDLAKRSPNAIPYEFPERVAKRLGAALQPLVNNIYWSRLWIVQEVCLARLVLIISSIGLISVECMEDIAHFSPVAGFDNLHLCERDATLEARISQVKRVLRLRRTFQSSAGEVNYEDSCGRMFVSPLSNCASFLRHSCQDPRDHIYAVPSLENPDGKFLVDYSETPKDTLRRLLVFMADQKLRFGMQDFLLVAKVLTKEPGESMKDRNPRVLLPPNQLCYVRFNLLSYSTLSLSECSSHRSVKSWLKCLSSVEPQIRANQGIECRCNCLWPGKTGIKGRAKKALYTRLVFWLYLDREFPRRIYLLSAMPGELLANPAPQVATTIAITQGPGKDTAHKLSESFQEDVRAYVKTHTEKPFMLKVDRMENPSSEIVVPLQAESFAQLCDIYNGFDSTPPNPS